MPKKLPSMNNYSWPLTCLDIVKIFIYCFAVRKTKESIIDAEKENIFVSSFIIICSMRRSRQSLFIFLFLTLLCDLGSHTIYIQG